jgi:hypothetical protein
MESPAPSGHPDPDLVFAWTLAMNAGVPAFPGDDEQAAHEALSGHPRPGRVRQAVQLLAEHVEASPGRLQAVAAAARSRHDELAAQGAPPRRSRPYLVAAALAGRGLAVIREGGTGRPLSAGLPAGPAAGRARPGNGQKLVWVLRLPQVDPPFTGDQRSRDGCMMPPLSWPRRLLRQAFPRRGLRDCCHHHRQDFRAIAAAVNAVRRQLRRRGLDGDDADELRFRLVQEARLSEGERSTALLLLDEDCGISIWRPHGERRWTYQDGRHRARALMDAGVRRILVTATDEHRSRG